MAWARVIGLAMLSAMALGPASAQDATEPAQAEEAATPAKSGGKSAYVKVLNGGDLTAYRTLFQLAAKGDIASIQAQSASVKNTLLMGHVLARAYLAQASSPSFADLQAWMTKYANYPEAPRIYALARKKDSDGALTEPEKRIVRGGADDGADLRTDIETDEGQSVARKVRALINDGRANDAQDALANASGLGPRDTNQLLAEVAGAHYYAGRNEAALMLAGKAAIERDHAPLADWIAGLAAWRLKNYADAAMHFEAMARQEEMTSWLKSAAGFWAGRAYVVSRQPQKARAMFEIAAAKPRTFYGLLALRVMGDKPPFTWHDPKLDPKTYQRVVKAPGISRAVALAQLGQRNLAEDVMLRAHGKLDRSLDGAYVALAADMGFAGAQFFGASAASNSAELKAGSFPTLSVQPTGGYQIDPALIHAIVRQESRFDPDAESHTGARGLMQVLPSTAKLGDDPRGRLFEPVYNLTVGQNYVRQMMRFTSPDGNLLQTAAAYNGGPGNLQKWLASVDYQDDPLLFIESLPSRETRGYVERVMANMWIYQMRMGKPTHSLDQLAAGQWPMYGPPATRSASLP